MTMRCPAGQEQGVGSVCLLLAESGGCPHPTPCTFLHQLPPLSSLAWGLGLWGGTFSIAEPTVDKSCDVPQGSSELLSLTVSAQWSYLLVMVQLCPPC